MPKDCAQSIIGFSMETHLSQVMEDSLLYTRVRTRYSCPVMCRTRKVVQVVQVFGVSKVVRPFQAPNVQRKLVHCEYPMVEPAQH